MRVYGSATSQDTAALLVRKVQVAVCAATSSPVYKPAEGAALITSIVDGGTYELYCPLQDHGGEAREPSNEGKRGSDNSAIFIACSRFAVFEDG